jgi:hypothetical protein
VRIAGGPLLHLAVDDQRANAKSVSSFLAPAGSPLME